MKISRKILKFTEPLTYYRGWRRVQRSMFRVSLAPMLENIDRERAREIQQQYANSTAGYAKYANIEPWLRLNRERVQDLNLHRSAPKRVLDLGCGGGFFLFILKRLGHTVLGLDVAQVSLFTELLELFSVPRVVWRINAFEPLPDLGQKFDWIYVDAAHRTVMVRKDLRNFFPLLKPGGLFAGDDWTFTVEPENVRLAVPRASD